MVKNYVFGIRDVNSKVIRHFFFTDDVEHTKREIRAALASGQSSPAYYSFPKEYELVICELEPSLFKSVALIADLLPENMPDWVNFEKEEVK